MNAIGRSVRRRHLSFNPQRTAQSLRYRVVAALLLQIVAFFPNATRTLDGAESPRETIEFERADIPADQPAAWPKEIDRCVPVPREEFLGLVERLKARNRSPRSVWLKSAHYEATLVKDTLCGGVMTGSVQRLESRPSLLELGPFSFALEELKWQDRAAVWGSSADGRVWVMTDGRNNELLGEWSCRGRSIPGGVDFDLQLPVATTSFLDLRVGRGFSVSSPTAEVTLMTDSPAEETRLWRIQCGSESRCRIACMAREGIEDRRQALIVEHELLAIVREEDLRFQLILHLEALDAPIKELSLKVPAGIEIYSAIYGADTPVRFQQTLEAETEGRLKIQLPGVLSGRGRTLRIDGIAIQKPGQPAISPQIVVENSTFAGGRHTLTVQSPLQVRSIRVHGYRQQSPPMPTPDGEKLTFQQLTSDAQLILDVYRQPVSLTGKSLSLLETDADTWKLTSEIIWTSSTSGGFRTSCRYPPEWEVTDVRLTGDFGAPRTTTLVDDSRKFREGSRKLNWDVDAQDGGRSQLSIEFLEAIQPGQPRSVRVFARRRHPAPNEAVPVPLPQLINCDASEVTLGIQVPSSMTLQLSEESRLERIAPPTTSPIAIPLEKANFERRWYRGEALDDLGTLKLVPRLPSVQLKMETAIEAVAGEFRTKYSIRSEGRQPLADRLLIYLTEPNTDVRWVLKGSQSIDLSASRLAKSQHSEWKLPSKGDLWEIRLPRIVGSDFVIEGTSSNRWSSLNRPALVFVPQASEKRSKVTLTHPESLELSFDTEGMKPTGERLSWWYESPFAELGLALRNPEPSHEFPQMVSIQLSTLMTTDDDGFDLYRARLQLENGSTHESLRIKLDPRAVLQETIVRGETIATSPRRDQIVISDLSATRRDVVELIYRIPSSGIELYERRQIVVPQVSAQILGFSWEFAIPPSTKIFSDPAGIRLLRPLPSPSWTERLFGPLGRSESEPIFQPFRLNSWVDLLNPPTRSDTSVNEFSGEFAAPVEWRVYRATAPAVPGQLSIELWHAARISMITWICLGFSLSLGVALRLIGWSRRDRVAAYVLGLFLAAAFSVPSPYSALLGAAISGTLVALLIPRYIMHSRNFESTYKSQTPRSLPATLTASLLGGLTFFGLTALSERIALAQEPIVQEGEAEKRPVVFVPVDSAGEPAESPSLVYVPRDTYVRWKRLIGERGIAPNYLISSAQYNLVDSTEGYLNLQANYRVHVLRPSDAPVVLELALSEVSLPDSESCRVNGRPHPISSLPNGKGYSIELAPKNATESEIPPNSAKGVQSDETTETFEIELRLRKPRPTENEFEFRIPAIAKSDLTWGFPDPVPFFDVIGGRGVTGYGADQNTIQSELGATSLIKVRWGQSASISTPARAKASLLQHLELRSSTVELHFHLTATIEEGNLDALEFDLPANAVIQSVQSRADDLLRSDTIVTGKGQRRLRLIFDREHRSPIELDGTLVMLNADPLVPTSVPKFGLAASPWVTWRFERNWWGVSPPTDFRLDTSNLDPESVNTIALDAYLQAWNKVLDPRRSELMTLRQTQSTFELREGTTPTFTLIPYQPRRTALHWKQTGSIGKRRLEWTLVGEIETSQAPTFQTVLSVDRRLRIEKVSVIEAEAERLLRWTESRTDPSRVVVFLRDKTQGKQTITLRGSLPLQSGTPVVLPFVRPEDCDIATGAARLELTRDPDVDVTLTLPREWALDSESPGLASSDLNGQIVLGQYRLADLTSRGTMQTSSRHSRCSSRAAVLFRRTDPSTWLLTYRIEMTPEGESPVRMGLNFPASFADTNRLTVENAEPAWRDPHDGIRPLDLLLNRGGESATVAVQFETNLAEPKQSDWTLPLPVPLHSNGHETLLVFDPENDWFPARGTEVRVADLPDWSISFFGDRPGSGSAFRVSGDSVQIQRDVLASVIREPSIRLLDQRMWLRRNGGRLGLTHAFLSSVRNDLEFELPPRVTVTAMFLDDHPLGLTIPVDRRLKIPMTDAGTESLLTIAWEFEPEVASFQASTTDVTLWPREIPVERNLITISPADEIALWCQSGVTDCDSLDQGLDRLQTLLDRHSSLGAETRGAESNRWWIEQLYTRLKGQMTKVVRQPTDVSKLRVSRWNKMVETINGLERVPKTPPSGWQTQLIEAPFAEYRSEVRGHGDKGKSIQLFEVDWRLLQLACSVVLALILVPIFRRLIRVEWSEWLSQQVIVSWALLAAVWWIFLTPSALGPILLLVGIIRELTHQKAADPVTE